MPESDRKPYVTPVVQPTAVAINWKNTTSQDYKNATCKYFFWP